LGKDWLLDGPANGNFGTDYHHLIGFTWKLSAVEFMLLTDSVSVCNSGLTNDNQTTERVLTATVSLTPFPPPNDQSDT
ncbi:MAG: hypothetical protein JWR40_3936, partial [Massilia sp.]|nr:hypothetical protein [Massilia sp.]